jgi:hypothetical protein
MQLADKDNKIRTFTNKLYEILKNKSPSKTPSFSNSKLNSTNQNKINKLQNKIRKNK